MTPRTLVDGASPRGERLVEQRDAATRQLTELAAAVREHEDSLRSRRPLSVRAQDDNLYRRLRQICGSH
jgi:hypothetical protein